MDVHDVSRWRRCEELARDLGVTIDLKHGIMLSDRRGYSLGVIATVAEVYAFLCGYEYSTHLSEIDELAAQRREGE